MKILIQNHTLAARTHAGCLPGAILLAGLLAAPAQPLQPEVLASLGGTNGAYPWSGLTLGNDGNFYGTTQQGGSGGVGTVFQMTPDGALTTLVSLNVTNGAYPEAALTLGSDGNLYGTTQQGGSGYGTVFKVTTNGTFTTLVSFNNTKGASPQGALTLGSDGRLYGTTPFGGTSGGGTVYSVTTNGALTTLASFTYANGGNNTNGSEPYAAPALGSDGNLYGTTSRGGSSGAGTVFKVTTNGILTTLASFNVANGSDPMAALTLGPDGSFYGTTRNGGIGSGTIFKVTTNGTLTTLVTFNGTNGSAPMTALTLGPDGNFYGTTRNGGSGGVGTSGGGTVFLMTPSGTLSTLASFPSYFGVGTNATGSFLQGGLTLGNDGNLYSTAEQAGGSAGGTVFRLGPTAPLIVSQPEPANLVVPAGVTVTIGAGVFGTLPLGYQWTLNSMELPVETNATLTLNNVIPSMSGNSYALRVTNSLGGPAFSSNAVLTVLPALITNLPVTGITATDAVLNGSVTLGSNETRAWFEWGTNTNYGQVAGVTDIPGGSGPVTVTVSNALSGLDGRMIYHFRIVASNSFGIAYGSDRSFQVGLIHAYPQNVLADQPLVYYRFDEASGTLAFNSGFLGAPANGTYNASVSLGNPSLVPAFGFAAGFNNTNSSVAVPALGAYNQITIEVWAKPRSFGAAGPGNPHSGYNSIYTTDNYVPGALHTHFINTFPNQRWQLAINPSHTDIEAGNSGLFPSNSWVHLAATHDSLARRTIAYVNGKAVLTNNNSTTVPVTLTAAHIGTWIGTQNWFDGLLDEFAIYGSVLPANRIQAHYQTAVGNPVLLSAQTTNKLNFSWIGPGFRLQRNANLSNAAGWTNVPAASNSPVSVTLSNSGNQFFRLRWP